MTSGATITVDAKTRGAEAGLGRVKRAYDGIRESARKAARSAAPVGAPGQGRARAAAVGGLVGGGAGSAVSSAAGAVGALGPLGAAAAAAAIAVRGFMAAADRAAASASRVYDTQQRLTDALRDAAHAAEDQAGASLESQRAILRELAARTGNEGVQLAQRLTAEGMRGAAEGLAAMARVSGVLDPAAIAAAIAAAKTGLMDFGEAAQATVGRRLSGNAAQDAASIVQSRTGRALSAEGVMELISRLGSSRVGRVTGSVDQLRGRSDSIVLDRALGGAAVTSAGRALHETTDPVARAKEREERAALRILESMNKAAEASGLIAETIREAGRVFGGEGSHATRAARRAAEMRASGLGN
jgi:hypothetical protein